ncbi:serine/arginine repetitive matrix protein 2 isoform X28 [Carassius gibelio]|uniref:serine/arginine repetitive matrix protein 2 isoform X20 n=1 Tax=Carassius gibelio TaxID=101364 RepID=UPI0022777A28|nr:serine/arginine repetitive matrix protein 2 isoform X20 [Carassius gibelio]XP_052462910.1 serine/arginine repetitive matrix protein 2 isoform X21 [Carassius gibelio]XP_052462911.1 serine/arginine repetitive matrix protein 2 isoform X22 [Carassius gibelio]XP_052462912.1 serine/arginine repetitive matrix protein 2 isoform X23 [Carassius gibelio]XP_052462913.1 serine/arginine repetitive matrix protein 2 isoform X24 [Carassius gibelio]XP_052462914.1 serine/arginine repetitive matrix protein 2 i
MPDESKKTHDSSFLYLITVINKSLHLSNPQAIMSQGLRRAPKKKNYADYIQDISSSDYLIPSPPPPQNYRGICTFPEPPKKYDTASKPSTASVPKNKKGNKPMKRVHSKMDPAEIFSEDLFSTPPTTNPCAMSPLDDHEMSTQSSCQQTPQRLSPIIELSTPHSMDSTRIDTPKRTKQAFRGRFSDLPICTSTPAFRTERQSRTPQSRISHASRTERQSRSPQVRNPQASRTERQSRTPQSRISQASRTERQSRSPQVRNPQASRTERQSMTPQSRISQASRTERQSRSPQVRNPQASRTERQSRSPQVRNPQASRTERQSRSPQVRNPQASRTERQSRTPQSRISQASRTERQSRSPQVRNPQASRTERQSMTPQSRISQASRTERQSGSPQVRNPQEKKDRFPMTDKRFQKKVLTQLLEIKDELRRIGKIVEPETGFHMSTLGTEDEFEYLERQLESGNTRAAMVTQLCKIGGKNFKDSTRRMLDSVLKNSLMSTFNMKGGGPLQKKSFQSTALFSVIRDAVMTSFPSATELEIKTAISNHFKQAPGRAGGGGYGSKVNS